MMTNSDAQRLRALEKDDKEFKQMVAYLLLLKRWDSALFWSCYLQIPGWYYLRFFLRVKIGWVD